MVGWHHRLNGHGFEWTPGVGAGQGSLVCCGSWWQRVWHYWATELNWTALLSGNFHGQRSLVGYSPWGRKESDTTEWLPQFFPPLRASWEAHPTAHLTSRFPKWATRTRNLDPHLQGAFCLRTKDGPFQKCACPTFPCLEKSSYLKTFCQFLAQAKIVYLPCILFDS